MGPFDWIIDRALDVLHVFAAIPGPIMALLIIAISISLLRDFMKGTDG